MLFIKMKQQDFLRDGKNISDSIAYFTRVYFYRIRDGGGPHDMIMVSHSLNNNTRTGYISLFKYKSFGQAVPPPPPPESPQILDIYSVLVL